MKDDLQFGKLNENCSLLKIYSKLKKMFLSPRPESNPQPSDQKVAGSIFTSEAQKHFSEFPLKLHE